MSNLALEMRAGRQYDRTSAGSSDDLPPMKLLAHGILDNPGT